MNQRVILRVWLGFCVIAGLSLFVSQLWEIPVRSALRGYDNTFNYLWLRSAAVDGDWDFRNDIQEANTLAPDHQISALGLPATPAGRIPNKYGIGWALVSAPFYWVADGIVVLGRSVGGWELMRDGFSPVYQVTLQLGQLGFACLGLWCAFRVIARWTGSNAAAWFGVSSVWAASSLLYYQSVNLSMSHSVGFSAIAIFAYALSRAMAAESRRWFAFAGAAFALAVITRFQLAAFGIVALWAVAARPGLGTNAATRALCFAGGAAPLLALQIWAWRVVYGEWLVFSYGAEGESFHWSRPELLNSLFSSWHGLFYWHPYLLVGLAGLIGWGIAARGVAFGWMVSFALVVYVSASWWCWWFASSFGNRSYDGALLPLMAGCAWLMQRSTPRWRTVLWSVAIAAGLWNFYVAILYRTAAISRSEPVTWSEMVRAAGRLPESAQF